MIYQFEQFELDPERRELKHDNVAIAVEPQVLDLLLLLVQERSRMVSKQELIEQIWAGRFVSDAALSSRVKSARAILGDNGKQQRMIRTIHGRGFRFVADVLEVDARPSAVSQDDGKQALHAQQPTIAVLDFANLSSDSDQDYFVNGITLDITNILSRHRWLDVLARNAIRPFVGLTDVYQQLREQAGVDYVVEGSVRKAGRRIRVSANLVSTQRGQTHWSELYDRDLQDVFEVQEEITATIVSRLEPEIGYAERQRVVRAPQRDLQAWDCYHLGVDHFFKFTAADNLQAQQLLDQSRKLDPKFGEAHAWWAYAVVLGMVYWDTPVSQAVLDEALAATEVAVDLDDRNAVLYALMARVRLARGEYAGAIRQNEMAIKLNPALASAHCGLADSLAYEGRYKEAIERFQHVIEMSDNDPQRWAFYTYGALAMIFDGDYERAVQWCDEALVIPNRQYWTVAHKMVALSLLGREVEAAAVKAQLLVENPKFSADFARNKLFYIHREEQLQCYLHGLTLAGFDS